ncbi:AAA domain-containing protein [Thermoflavimicrobium dichotomicum]|uniref:Superfamily I DNA and/or RNA helicase n=1 Tax=Thermoflavimicrobium dichotomicum TaxID=46223 RepID=A0A1I3LJ07_9BACL|nr:AAA domain-containing protein [Thermoflavimicrobium dichotomicum]SFI84722.1 Superfamily I DNA and/or RNA helicase [Thermoflavimicrobium dichotomicum]
MEQKLVRLKDRLSDISHHNRSIRLIKLFNKWAFDLTELAVVQGEGIIPYILDEIKKRNALIPILTQFHSDLQVEELDKKLLSIYRNIKQIEEETGRYDLSIGYPFLSGTLEDGTFIQAPLLLYPVRLIRCETHPYHWKLCRLDTEPQLNRALFLALKQRHQCSIDEMVFEDVDRLTRLEGQSIAKWAEWLKQYHVDVSYRDESVQSFTSYTQTTLPKHAPLEIKPYLILASFPQGNTAILHDYQRLIQSVESQTHPLVSALLTNKPVTKKSFNDEMADMEPFYLLPTDHSQEEILQQARTESALVVSGPPGTGKSQLIVNLITDALAQNKKVLMVSNKRAALDVVYERLEKLGLSPYIALIHDEKTDRRHVYDKIHQLTTKFHSNIPNHDPFLRKITQKIEEHEQKLNEIYKALHEIQVFGLSAYQLYSRAKKVNQTIPVADIAYSIHVSQFNKITQTISRYANFYEKFSKDTYILKERRPFSDISNEEIQKLEEHLDMMISKAKHILNRMEEMNLPQFTPKYLWSIAKQLQQLPIKLKPQDLNLWEKTKLVWWTNFQGKKIIHELAQNQEQQTWEQISRRLLSMNKIAQISKELHKDLQKLDQILPPERIRELQEQLAEGLIPHDSLKKIRKALADDFHQLKEMDRIYETTTPIIKTFIERLKEMEPTQEFPLSKVWTERVYQSLYHHWIEEIEKKYPILSLISTGEIEQIRESYRQLLAEKRKLARQVLLSDLQYGTNQLLNRYPREFEELRRETKKRKKVWPIRKLIHRFFYRGLLEILPVWLVSPEIASSIFPLQKECFDLLIIDEATQCPIEQCIPVIFRSKQMIVIGDEKQVLPSHASMTLDDSPDTRLDQSDHLFLRSSEVFNKQRLRYHYRSDAEELIHFSNHGFYQGQMLVAPNVYKSSSQPAIYWKKTDHDLDEARTAVSLLDQLLQEHPDKTIGIITFHAEQKEMIMEIIEETLKSDPFFHKRYMQAMERSPDQRLFIKRIEEAQGDVRDFIILSLGYAKNEQGKVPFFFDVLGLEKGENYLNIAITRSRKRLFVLSSIDPEVIELLSNDFPGPEYFKHFLEYAQAVHEQDHEQIHHVLWKINGGPQIQKHVDTPFENQVLKALLQRGYSVDAKVGFSHYQIDLAIIHPQDPTRYILGIECDGAMYRSAADVKEREVHRHEILKQKGWTIKRIWSRNWWQDPGSVLQEIEETIQDLMNQGQPIQKIMQKENQDEPKVASAIVQTQTIPEEQMIQDQENDLSFPLREASEDDPIIQHILAFYHHRR